MENNVKIKLSDEQVNLLEQFPEQGMGYQIVDIKLKNGDVLKEKFVFNSTYLQLSKNEKITIDDIDTIQIHKNINNSSLNFQNDNGRHIKFMPIFLGGDFISMNISINYTESDNVFVTLSKKEVEDLVKFLSNKLKS
ncbi:MAG: hypothetical protein LBD52_01720 [Prevotellaceae bacterium]|jgi:Holliday junction resolvase|nr:hypothetical protein [Prevotellaceae bacterium]